MKIIPQDPEPLPDARESRIVFVRRKIIIHFAAGNRPCGETLDHTLRIGSFLPIHHGTFNF